MADVLTKKQRSYNMSKIRGKNTIPEMQLRKSLWNLGYRYRIHYRLPGRPDVVFVGRRVVIFVDGCFWHGCPDHYVHPKTNSEFWKNKIKDNMKRDTLNQVKLAGQGWIVLRFWEHDINDRLLDVIETIAQRIKQY